MRGRFDFCRTEFQAVTYKFALSEIRSNEPTTTTQPKIKLNAQPLYGCAVLYRAHSMLIHVHCTTTQYIRIANILVVPMECRLSYLLNKIFWFYCRGSGILVKPKYLYLPFFDGIKSKCTEHLNFHPKQKSANLLKLKFTHSFAAL